MEGTAYQLKAEIVTNVRVQWDIMEKNARKVLKEYVHGPMVWIQRFLVDTSSRFRSFL